jgi:predicted O-methyltransferase YrrM
MGLRELLPENTRRRLRAVKRTIKRVQMRLTRANLYNLSSPHRVGVIYAAPSDMKIDERLYLYSFVRGFRPARALEIGVLHGGSGCIIANAMEDNGLGVIVGVDPGPEIYVPERDFHGRYRLVAKPSPEGLPEARRIAGGEFDFVFIDGLHMYDQVRLDIKGVLPLVCEGAYIMFHDAFHYGVSSAITEAVEGNSNLHDCGYPCRTPRIEYDSFTPYNGVRLLRYSANSITPAYQIVSPFYQAIGKIAPPVDAKVFNHDQWHCRTFAPCPRCQAEAESLLIGAVR